MRCLLVLLALVQIYSAPALAAAIDGPNSLRAAANRFLNTQANTAYPDSTVNVLIGPVDERLDLSDCSSASFFLPPGSHPWGAGTLGVQCSAPSHLIFYLTYRIRLHGPALVAARPMASNYAPRTGDIEKRVIEYMGDPGRYLRDSANLHGATLIMPLTKGAPLSIDMLRIPPIVQAGQQVRIVSGGPGFQVSQIGVAQQQAKVGDLLRLKLSSGRYVQGVVQEDGTVYVAP